jgi:hypothetical protein
MLHFHMKMAFCGDCRDVGPFAKTHDANLT